MDEIKELLRCQNSDDDAAKAFVTCYFQELILRVRRRYYRSEDLLNRIDPSAVANSACETFIRRVKEGKIKLAEIGDVFAFVVTIALRKAAQKVEWHLAQKRSVRRETGNVSKADPAPELSPDLDVMVKEELDFMINKLPENHRNIIKEYIQGNMTKDIAKLTGYSTTTVRKVVNRFKEIAQQRLNEADA